MKTRQIVLKSGRRAWQVDLGQTAGKRVRREFSSRNEALKFANEARKDSASIGVLARNLSMRDRAEAAEARTLLGTVSLIEVARFYLSHAMPGQGVSLAEATRQYLNSPTRTGMRASSRQGAQWRINRLTKALGHRAVSEITIADMGDYLAQWQGFNGLNHRKYAVAFFNFTVRRGWRKDNPAAGVPKPILTPKTPAIFATDEAQGLLDTTVQIYPRLLPALAIGLFAGLRQAEIAELDWRHVNLAELIIRVDPEIAKARRARIVDILPNLAAWLKPYAQPTGRIGVPRCVYQRHLKRILRAANITRWPSNGLRHSFASYHVACFQDAGCTAAQLGHVGNVAMLYDHYRAIVRREDAERYWAIAPTINCPVTSRDCR